MALSLLERFLAAFLLATALGIGHVTSACKIPPNLMTFLSFNDVVYDNATLGGRYIVNCLNSDLRLFPLGDRNDVHCENGTWRDSVRGESFALEGLQCLKMCSEPRGDHLDYKLGNQAPELYANGALSGTCGRQTCFVPRVTVNLTCKQGLELSSRQVSVTCDDSGEWMPPLPSCIYAREDNEETSELNNTMIISVTVSVIVVLTCIITMVTIAVRAKWRLVCRKRRVPTSHPDDINYPHGYTQLGSGSMLPSYAEATDDGDQDSYRENLHFASSGVDSVYRPTTTSDYRQLSSLELSSRGESESLSAGSHRHSLFSGTSANFRHTGGDNISDILQGDHLSMSDTSTLVTVNTYESNRTASNPSLTNSRRGVAGSMNTNTSTSMDDAPLIVRGNDDDMEEEDTVVNSPASREC